MYPVLFGGADAGGSALLSVRSIEQIRRREGELIC